MFEVTKEGGVIPIGEMWSWRPVWLVFKDLDNILCDVTGHIIGESEDEYIIGNREDHKRYSIPKQFVEHLEEVTDES